MYISVNGELIKNGEYGVSPLSEGFAYGFGLFETIKIKNSELIFFDEHIDRLKKSCAVLNMDKNSLLDMSKNLSYELIKANKITNGALKITYSKNSSECDLIISTKNYSYPNELYKRGFRLCFSDIKKNPYSAITYIKSNNFLENMIVREDIQRRNYDEAIFLNVENKLSEGTIANLFFVKDNTIYTPAISCGILPGIMREKVIQLIQEKNLNIIIGEFEKKELLEADEIFLTNSLMDIMPVSKLEDKEFSLKNNLVTKFLMDCMKSY